MKIMVSLLLQLPVPIYDLFRGQRNKKRLNNFFLLNIYYIIVYVSELYYTINMNKSQRG